jgi:hypothetical protein
MQESLVADLQSESGMDVDFVSCYFAKNAYQI